MATTPGISGNTPAAYYNGALGSNKGTLSMNDFFTLLSAQLSNQDMYNTMDDSAFMSQMAQFSMVQALSELSQLSMMSYGTSMIGKQATVAMLDKDGYLDKKEGIVEAVNFFNGETQLVIEGSTYGLSSVMELAEPKIIIPKPGDNVNDTDDKENGEDEDGENVNAES